MIHGYHIILPMYGFWLPNDPRGSWSDFVRKWELVQFGRATQTIDRRKLVELTDEECRMRVAARSAMSFPPVSIDERQAQSIGGGFESKASRSNYTIWACSILGEHTHLVIARHTYKIEQIANLLKGAATSRIIADGRHPLARHAAPGQRPPRIWAARLWKVYLDSEPMIDEAIRYVEDNPAKEGKSPQRWRFVQPFTGIDPGGWTSYH